MREELSGRLELTRARARAMFGSNKSESHPERTESSGDELRPPGEEDAQRIATRIRAESGIEPTAALVIARGLVEQARAALEKDYLSDAEALALESVIHVRGRPALRVIKDHLESLAAFPGSELWQGFITDYEDGIVAAAAATGGVFIDAFATGNPRWLQGSAWMVAHNRVVTNRHVLLPESGQQLIDPGVNESSARLREGFNVDIEFAADNRNPAACISRRVTSVLFVANAADPVDVAILTIEPYSSVKPLVLAKRTATPPKNLYVVGHPALTMSVANNVKTVFGNPDGKKRVSFGQLLHVIENDKTILHDASTVGGYSGGPVLGISGGEVAGLHYYGDPAMGNCAVSAVALHEHAVEQYLVGDE
jgi:hypothetical protein